MDEAAVQCVVALHAAIGFIEEREAERGAVLSHQPGGFVF